MPSISPPRRAASLLAAGATGAAAVLLGFTNPAHATTLNSFTISTDSGGTADQVVSGSYTIPTGYCSVTWNLSGAGGGVDYDGVLGGQNGGGFGGALSVTTPVTAGQTVTLVTGAVGAAGTASGAGAGGAGAPAGASGVTQVDGSSNPIGGGGGGGGATSVSLGALELVARGGDGAATDSGQAGGAGGNGAANTVSWTGSSTSQDDPAGGGNGAGSIDGTVDPCPAGPVAPTLSSATGGDGEATLWYDFHDYADSWQYSTDGGTTWTAATGATNSSMTVPGLTNGTTYSVRVRGMAGTTAGDPSNALSVTPAVPIGAPTHVVVTPGPSSYVVTWDAPTTSGTFPVAGYVVSWSGGQMGGALCENVPVSAERRCVGAAVPGSSYTVSVWAVDTKGNDGTRSADVPVGTVAAPAVPAAPPTSADKLALPAGAKDAVAAGATMTLSGSGYLPNSTVSLIIYSSPQVLTSVVTDASGNFTVSVTVPKGLESGHHTLVASGVDPAGAVRYVTLPVTVSGGTTGAGGLAYTGVDVAMPLTVGLIALAAGAGLMVVARRRKGGTTV